jgi:hypothetical protein
MRLAYSARGRVATLLLTLGVTVGGGPTARSFAQTPAGSQPATPAGAESVLMGQVVEVRRGPIAGAVVTMSTGTSPAAMGAMPSSTGGLATLTNSDGHFVFWNLPKGSYALSALAPGYVPGAYGRRRPGGPAQSIELTDGERNTSVTINLWKYAAISGTVTDETGAPVVGIQVWAYRRVFIAGHQTWQPAARGPDSFATTDDRGIFRLGALLPGDYLVAIPTTYETLPPSFTAAYAAANQAGDRVFFGSYDGIDIVANVFRVGTAGVRSGDLVGRPIQPPPALPSLMAALRPDGQLSVYPTTFYPGTMSLADAKVVSAASGDERAGMDIPWRPMAAGRVTGMAVGPDGPVPNLGIRLVPLSVTGRAADDFPDTATTVTNAQGGFTLLGVPAGQYLLRALRLPSRLAGGGPGRQAAVPNSTTDSTLFANVPVTVMEGAPATVSVTLTAGLHVQGRLAWDGTHPKPPADTVARLLVRFDPVDGPGPGAPISGRVDESGQITATGLFPGRYFVRLFVGQAVSQGLSGWALDSAMLSGRDVSVMPVDFEADTSGLVVTLTDHPSELAGTVRDAQGRAGGGAAILVFPVASQDWVDTGAAPRRLQKIRPGADGSYDLLGLPAGEYFVAAVPDEQSADWPDPAFLQRASRGAVRITLAHGEHKTQSLTTTRDVTAGTGPYPTTPGGGSLHD